MSEIENTEEVVELLSDDEVGEHITDLFNVLADMHDDMVVFRQLTATFGAHLNREGKIDLPGEALRVEIVRAVGGLENRIVIIEEALRKAGIAIPHAADREREQ